MVEVMIKPLQGHQLQGTPLPVERAFNSQRTKAAKKVGKNTPCGFLIYYFLGSSGTLLLSDNWCTFSFRSTNARSGPFERMGEAIIKPGDLFDKARYQREISVII